MTQHDDAGRSQRRGIEHQHLAAVELRPVCVTTLAVSSPGRRGVMKRETYSRVPSAVTDRCRGVGAHAERRRSPLPVAGSSLQDATGGLERDERRAAIRREHEAERLRSARQRDRPRDAEASPD